MRISPVPATRAITAFPAAWATSNQMPAETSATNDDASAPGPNALHSQTSLSQSKPERHTMPNAASANRFRRTRGIQPAISPTRPQPSICQGVHGPWPRNASDASAAAAPVARPALGPRLAPVTAVIIVTGWTLGTAAKTTRPGAAPAASGSARALWRPPGGAG